MRQKLSLTRLFLKTRLTFFVAAYSKSDATTSCGRLHQQIYTPEIHTRRLGSNNFVCNQRRAIVQSEEVVRGILRVDRTRGSVPRSLEARPYHLHENDKLVQLVSIMETIHCTASTVWPT